MFDSTKRRAMYVREIVEANYEAGWQARSLKWVWRQHVNPVLPMSFGTFKRLLYSTGWRAGRSKQLIIREMRER